MLCLLLAFIWLSLGGWMTDQVDCSGVAALGAAADSDSDEWTAEDQRAYDEAKAIKNEAFKLNGYFNGVKAWTAEESAEYIAKSQAFTKTIPKYYTDKFEVSRLYGEMVRAMEFVVPREPLYSEAREMLRKLGEVHAENALKKGDLKDGSELDGIVAKLKGEAEQAEKASQFVQQQIIGPNNEALAAGKKHAGDLAKLVKTLQEVESRIGEQLEAIDKLKDCYGQETAGTCTGTISKFKAKWTIHGIMGTQAKVGKLIGAAAKAWEANKLYVARSFNSEMIRLAEYMVYLHNGDDW